METFIPLIMLWYLLHGVCPSRVLIMIDDTSLLNK
jgi:hypothetical protein